ncbi:MAG: nucleotidyltransferase domain-containing protein [Deltaproteobacteria bacterium]|nr:nucleotidyltransferase domain-containing protein [Deltaproteobacteria bacterium]
MVEKKVQTVIHFLNEKLKEQKISVSKIILFGSHAIGKADKDSDIDIVVVSDDFSGKNIFKRIELIKDAEIQTIKKFKVPLDIITMTHEEYENRTSIIAEYAHEGTVLFAN